MLTKGSIRVAESPEDLKALTSLGTGIRGSVANYQAYLYPWQVVFSQNVGHRNYRRKIQGAHEEVIKWEDLTKRQLAILLNMTWRADRWESPLVALARAADDDDDGEVEEGTDTHGDTHVLG